jgi:hypothetical protein
MSGVRLPERKQIRDLFEGLLGRDVAVSDGSPVEPGARPAPLVGVYVDDRTQLSSVVLMDFRLAAFAGAALGLVPRGGAEAAIEDRDLPPMLVENAAELLNVLAAPVGDASGVHQRLYQTVAPGEAVPADVAAWAVTLGFRTDLTLDIKAYGAGVLSIVSALREES